MEKEINEAYAQKDKLETDAKAEHALMVKNSESKIKELNVQEEADKELKNLME